MTITPIETTYKGYRFRSRLEARWAVFFDAMGIKFVYEPDTFDLDGTCYLPDFWLPTWKMFVEIKPIEPTEEQLEKCFKLSELTDKDVLLIAGQPWTGEYKVYVFFGGGGGIPKKCHSFLDNSECYLADKKKGLPRTFIHTSSSLDPLGDIIFTKSKAPKIIKAFTAARQERFGA